VASRKYGQVILTVFWDANGEKYVSGKLHAGNRSRVGLTELKGRVAEMMEFAGTWNFGMECELHTSSMRNFAEPIGLVQMVMSTTGNAK